jgi:hypothetical protein
MTEVGGTGAVYFDPNDPKQAANAIAVAWPQRAEQRRRGLEEANRWKPETMLAAYEAIYRELAKNR